MDTAAYILASADRCRNAYKLDPALKPRNEHIGDVALRLRHESHSLLEYVGRPEMRRLFGELADANYILLLTDATGVILDICTSGRNIDLARAANLAAGYTWDERHEGTNGPGTCLHDGAPRVVHRDQHFFFSNRRMTCAAAPIWGPNGQLLGALDASRLETIDSSEGQTSTLTLISFSARIIEQLYFIIFFSDCLIMRLHEQPTSLGLPQDSLLAIDGKGNVRAADRGAHARLQFRDPKDLLNKSVSDLFDLSVEHLFARANTQPAMPWLLEGRQGEQTYVTLWRTDNKDAARVARGGSDARSSPQAAGVRTKTVPFVAPAECDPRVAEVIRQANLVMNRDIHVLLQGETGTGKDVFARAIHDASERTDRPYIAVNCAALPETLIESELFGYGPGAFTGAHPKGMRGKVLAAHTGTLFLDEIGDMPVMVQARLLRMLEQKEVVPLGSTRAIKVDTKIISATHRDLKDLVARGAFRADLYYQLSGLTLTLPPLRVRSDKRSLIEIHRQGGGRRAHQHRAEGHGRIGSPRLARKHP